MSHTLLKFSILTCTLLPISAMASSLPSGQTSTTLSATAPAKPVLVDIPPLRRAAQTLNQHGIQLDMTFVDDFIANPGTGIDENKTGNLGLFGINASFDLGKMIGLKGATLHEATTIYGLRRNSHMLTNVGGMLGTINYIKYHDAVVLNLLTYEQKIGPLDLEAGRTNALRYFWTQNCDNPFNCEPAVIAGDAPLIPVRYATWGGRAKYQISPAWYLQAGGFEDNTYNLNTNGLHFSTKYGAGVLGIGEVGYTTTFKTSALPAHYEFGLWGDTSPHYNPYLSALGRPLPAHPHDAKRSIADPVGIFAEGRQVAWVGQNASVPGAQPQNFAVTWGVFAPVTGGQNFDFEGWLGGIFTGVIPGRPFDHFGMRLHYLRVGANLAHAETLSRILAGGNADPQPRNEYSLEASYSLHIAPGIVLEPTAQYLFNQDTYYYPHTRVAPRNGFVVSAFLVMSLGQMLGLPPVHY